jgi:UDP-glucose:(heptosyl)LPS alpha-1,3-glucosyltransferase
MTKPSVTLIKSQLFRQGGLEKYTWQIAADFCAIGSSVTVLTTGNPSPPFDHPLLKIVSLLLPRYPLSFLNVLHFDKACDAYLAQHPTPVVFSLDRNRFQTHMRAGNGVHAAYLKRRSSEEGPLKKLSFALNPLHHAILSLEKKGFEHPDLKILFTNSEMVKQEVLQFYHTDPEKIRVVHNGVEWQAMQQAFDQWEVQKEKTLSEIPLDKTAFQFLFVGHNFHRKGLDKLLHALALIKQEHFQLSVLGKEKDLGYFKELTQRLELGKKVFFFGSQMQALPFYQIADCLVIPSLYDPFANVTVEALAMGVFVLSSKNNGGHEVLTEHNGSIIDSLDDPLSFAETLKTVLNRPKTHASAASIRQTIKHLDFSNQLRTITELSIK